MWKDKIDSRKTTLRNPTYSNSYIHFFFFFFFGGPWSESLLLPESELSEDEEEDDEDEELSSSLSLLLSLSSEEELEESLLSDDESLEEPSESLLLSLESLALRVSSGAQKRGAKNTSVDVTKILCWICWISHWDATHAVAAVSYTDMLWVTNTNQNTVKTVMFTLFLDGFYSPAIWWVSTFSVSSLSDYFWGDGDTFRAKQSLMWCLISYLTDISSLHFTSLILV